MQPDKYGRFQQCKVSEAVVDAADDRKQKEDGEENQEMQRVK